MTQKLYKKTLVCLKEEFIKNLFKCYDFILYKLTNIILILFEDATHEYTPGVYRCAFVAAVVASPGLFVFEIVENKGFARTHQCAPNDTGFLQKMLGLICVVLTYLVPSLCTLALTVLLALKACNCFQFAMMIFDNNTF